MARDSNNHIRHLGGRHIQLLPKPFKMLLISSASPSFPVLVNRHVEVQVLQGTQWKRTATSWSRTLSFLDSSIISSIAEYPSQVSRWQTSLSQGFAVETAVRNQKLDK